MEKKKCGNRYAPEVRMRSVRMVNLTVNLRRSSRLPVKLYAGLTRFVRGFGALRLTQDCAMGSPVLSGIGSRP